MFKKYYRMLGRDLVQCDKTFADFSETHLPNLYQATRRHTQHDDYIHRNRRSNIKHCQAILNLKQLTQNYHLQYSDSAS